MKIKPKTFSYLFFPKRCAVCNKVLHISYDFCANCEKTLRPIPEHYQNMFLSNPNTFKKKDEKIYYNGMAGAYFHSDGSKDLIYNYKFNSRSELAEIIGIALANTYNEYLTDKDIDCICTVPTTFYKSLQRGFDHTGRITKGFSKYIGVPYVKALNQVKHKRTQHKLNSEDRRTNVKGVWAINKNISIRGKNVLLVDDIVTTGATVNECSKILKAGGAKSVWCLACNLNI